MTDTYYRRRVLRRPLYSLRFVTENAVGVLPGKAWIMTIVSPAFASMATGLLTWHVYARGSDGGENYEP